MTSRNGLQRFRTRLLHLGARLEDFGAKSFDLAADLSARRQMPGWLFGHWAPLARTGGSTTGVTDAWG